MKKVLLALKEIKNNDKKELFLKDLAISLHEKNCKVAILANSIESNPVMEALRVKGIEAYSSINYSDMPKEYDVVIAIDQWAVLNTSAIKATAKGKVDYNGDVKSVATKIMIGKDLNIVSNKSTKKILKNQNTKKKIADIIIPHHNRHDLLKECLDSFTNEKFNIIIVSGGSFARNCNMAAKLAQTNKLIFLNDDIITSNEMLEELVSHEEDIVGVPCHIVGSDKIAYGMNMTWGEYKGFNSVKTALEFKSFDNCKIPATGAFFMIKKKAWKKLKGFREFYKNGGEDNHLFLEALESGMTFGHINSVCEHYHSSSEGRHDNDISNHKTLTKHFPLKRLQSILESSVNGELVSIIIPTISNKKPVCLKSIKKQTYRNIEVIIQKDLKRKGASWARNRGFKKAKGKFVFFCDDDIELKENIIEIMVNKLRNSSHSFCYCNYKKTGLMTGKQTAREWNYSKLKESNYISTMSLIKTKDFPGFDETLERFQDWDLWLTMAENGKTGIFVDRVLFSADYKKGDISTNEDNFDKWVNIVKRKHKIK